MNGPSTRWLLRVQSIVLIVLAVLVGLHPPDPCRNACIAAIEWPPFRHPDPTYLRVGAILAILGIVGLIQSFRAQTG
jgi:hypothetical protein